MTARPLFAFAAALALSGAALAQQPSPATLRVALNSDIRSTDPGANRDANTDAVVQHMIEGLVAFRENGSVGPMLAEKVEMSEDGKSYSFTLREGLRFHNGEPVTAEDVVWSWKRYLDPATKWRCLPEFDGRGITKVTDVSAKDARTVTIAIERPSALFLVMMARQDCGSAAVLHKDSVDEEGKWKAPIGTGPFKFGEWRKGEYIELVRFAEYASLPGPRDGYTGGKQALVEKVRFAVIPDSSAAKAALLSGSLDVLPDVANADVKELQGRPEVTISISPTMSMNAILFQTKDPLVGDPRIRKAIAHAINADELVEAVTEGTSKPNSSPIPSPSPYYSEVQAKRIPHDLALAKKLLAEAGYRGQPIKLLANKRYPTMYDSAVLTQAMAQQAGINMELEVLDWATQLDRYTKGDYQAQSFSYSARLDPSLSFEMFMGSKEKQPRKIWDNPEAQALMEVSMTEQDPKKRQAIFDDLYGRFLAEMPLIVLYNGAEVGGVRKGVEGYSTWAMGAPRLWGVSVQK